MMSRMLSRWRRLRMNHLIRLNVALVVGFTGTLLAINIALAVHVREAHAPHDTRVDGLTALSLFSGAAGFIAMAITTGLVLRSLRDERRMRKDLRVSEGRFRALVEATSDWVWELGPDSRYTFVGPRAKEILGRDPDALLGKSPSDLLSPTEWERVKSELRPYILAGARFPVLEVEVIHPSGRVVYVESTGMPIVGADGSIRGYRGIDRDITSRKRAQQALRDSEMRLAEAQAVARMGSGEADLVTKQFSWSAGVYRILELHPGDVHPSLDHYWRRIPAESRPAFLRFCARVRRACGSFTFQHSIVFPDGREKALELRMHTVPDELGRPARVVGTMQDITERKQTERKLRDSETRLRAAVEFMPSLFHAFDEEGRFIVWNREWERVTGYSKQTMIGNALGLTLLFPDPVQRKDFWNAWQLTKTSAHERAWDVTCADGSVRTVVWANMASRHPITGWASWGVGKDITERRRADAERNLLMAAIEQAVEHVVIADMQGRVEYANPAFERDTGYRRHDIVSKVPWFLFTCDDSPDQLETILPRLQQGILWQGRFEIRRNDGTTFYEDARVFPVKNEQGAVTNIVMVGRDVTQELRLQAQLQQRQKLEALGTLAGGVAHDFNNLLMPIMGFTELILDRMNADDAHRHYLEEILTASVRARDIVRQMLTFSRQGPAECQPVQLKSAMREALRLLRASIPSTVTIVDDIQSDGELVWADPTQIHQILMNVCTNAYQAMPDHRGRIDVTVDRTSATESMAELYPPLKAGQWYVRIRVRDDGCGMDHATVARIFDPFYTTKPFGQGTGLGLATVHGIVSSLRGAVAVESEPGHGTEFSIYLPEHRVHAVTSAPVDPEAPRGSGERILLVDDELAVLATTQRLVESLGYEVTAVSSSIDALDRVAAEPSYFDLVLTDQTMPSLTGAQLAAAVRQIRVDIPIVLATGFSESILPDSLGGVGVQHVLQKPFSKQDLAGALHNALSSHAQAVG